MKINKKDVAIIEIYSHHVFVHTLSASLLAAGHNVTVYVSNRIYKDLEPMFLKGERKPKFCISNKGENDFTFLLRARREIENHFDLLFINSIQGYRVGYFYFLKFKIPTIAAAGRISEFFGSRYRLSGLMTLRQILHHNYTRYFLPKIIKRLSGIIVHTTKAKEMALNGGYKKPIHCMPFSLHIPTLVDTDRPNNKVHFLITGQITERSRDYFGILKVFETIWESGVRNAELTILSSPMSSPVKDYAYKVFDEMERLSSNGYPITYFSDWIPEADFVAHSSRADFLIAPILKDYYGAGEITSVEVESVRMGIPAFYPDWYFIDPTMRERGFSYSSLSHLSKMIIKFCDDTSSVISIRSKALMNAEKLSVDIVSKELDKFLTEEFIIADNSVNSLKVNIDG